MAVQHSTLTGAENHEPKGVESAAAGALYQASGIGSGTWNRDIIQLNSIATLGATGGSKGADTVNAVSYFKNGVVFGLTSMVAQATTSGTFKDFTGIPAGVKRITIAFNAVSTNSNSQLLVQLGLSAVETTGYTSYSATNAVAAYGPVTNGFLVDAVKTAGTKTTAIMTLINISGNSWIASSTTIRDDSPTTSNGSGTKTFTSVPDTLRVTTTGADTFDFGSVNVMYE